MFLHVIVYRNKPTAAWNREVQGICESALHESRDAQGLDKSYLHARGISAENV